MTEHAAQLENALATDAWKQWEGQTVNGQFPLHRYLGGSGHSAVFLTTCGEGAAQTAAIKLLLDDSAASEQHAAAADQRVISWKFAAGISHPNLIRIFQGGRSTIEGVPLLYVVMECAEEDLSQIIPQRALTPSEAREMLRPALDALAYLHGMGFAHGHIKPSNVMAREDQLKLSADTLFQIGEPVPIAAALDIYCAPERKHSAASDSWALGMTLVEVLTQRLPLWDRADEAEPVVPDSLAEPFLQIARRCLRRNPSLRLRAPDIAERIEPLPVQQPPSTPTASQIAASQPLVASRPVVASKPPVASRLIAASQPIASARPNYFARVVALALLIAAVAVISIRSKHNHLAPPTAPIALNIPKPQNRVPEAAVEKAPVPAPPPALAPTPTPPPAPVPALSEAPTSTPAPEPAIQQPVLQAEAPPPVEPVAEEKKPAPSTAQNEGIHQVLPDVPQKARDTIHGTVRLSVKVIVDPAGSVVDAALHDAGPSPYFANLALRAAQKWTFGAADTSGANGNREWILHFAFKAADTQARAEQSGR
jgi:serine/threonine protein kinase